VASSTAIVRSPAPSYLRLGSVSKSSKGPRGDSEVPTKYVAFCVRAE
jgi:hypothetical protein